MDPINIDENGDVIVDPAPDEDSDDSDIFPEGYAVIEKTEVSDAVEETPHIKVEQAEASQRCAPNKHGRPPKNGVNEATKRRKAAAAAEELEKFGNWQKSHEVQRQAKLAALKVSSEGATQTPSPKKRKGAGRDDIEMMQQLVSDEEYGDGEASGSGVGTEVEGNAEDLYDINQIDDTCTVKKKPTATPISTQTMDMAVGPDYDDDEEDEEYFEGSPGKCSVSIQTEHPRKKNVKVEEDDYFSPKKARRSRGKNPEEALKCPFCEKSLVGLVAHLKARHSDAEGYEEELKNTKWRERIMKSTNAETSLNRGECNQCGKVVGNLHKHMETHNKNQQMLPCGVCGKVLRPATLSSHMRNVHSDAPCKHKCPHCDYSSNFKGNMTTHIKGVHIHTREYLCQTCHAAFKTLTGLIGHTKHVHEGWKSPNQKVYVCSVCERKFSKKYHVERHMLIHTGQKPYKCKICGRSFNNASNRDSHITYVHNKLSPYQCDLCAETFDRKKLLLEHIGKIHVASGEHIVYRTYADESEEEKEDEEEEEEEEETYEGVDEEGVTKVEPAQQVEIYDPGDYPGQEVTLVVEDHNTLPTGHITTTESETETIIIYHGDGNDVVVQPTALEIIYN